MTSAKILIRLSSVAVVVLLAAACGGGDDEPAAPPESDPSSTGEQSDQPTDDGSTGSVDDLLADAEQTLDDLVDDDGGVASITIGDETWEFTLLPGNPIASCDADFFGGFLGVFTSVAEITTPGDTFAITLPGGAFTDPPDANLSLQVDADAKWSADETIYERYPDLPAGIGITSFSIDGNTATGSGVFVEEDSVFQVPVSGPEALRMEEGSFQVTCG